MNLGDWLLLVLRIGHALAALVWLGGGVYYLLVIRPSARSVEPSPHAFISTAQQTFGEWAQVAVIVMLATGAVLTFDRLANDGEGLGYAALLAAKVVAAVAAFWIAGFRPAQLRVRRRDKKRSRAEIVVTLGLFAFIVGVALSTVYGRSAT